jgi:hypothetical protein
MDQQRCSSNRDTVITSRAESLVTGSVDAIVNVVVGQPALN